MLEIRLFDIHSHINDPKFDADRGEVIARMKTAGVATCVVGTDKFMSQKAVELAEANEHVWAIVGMHPADNHTEIFEPDFYRELLKYPKVVGIGECGLDYGRKPDEVSEENKQRQKEIFVEHIQLAKEFDKPLMIHCRNAYGDLLELLKLHGEGVRGNMHFFAGDWAAAQQFLALGFSLSFDGPITFAREYDEVIRTIPLDRLMAETDAPYVAPVPHRGQRNEPAFVEDIVKTLAEIRGESYETVRTATVQNATKFFGT